VDEFRKYLVRHPALVAVAFAFLVGTSTYNAFHAGIRIGDLRAQLSDHARAASEALGG
jgi:hypothetical protein